MTRGKKFAHVFVDEKRYTPTIFVEEMKTVLLQEMIDLQCVAVEDWYITQWEGLDGYMIQVTIYGESYVSE